MIPEEHKKEIVNLYKQGFTYEEIGKMFNRTKQSIYDLLKRHNLIVPRKFLPFFMVDGMRFSINSQGYYACRTKKLRLHIYLWEKENGKKPDGYDLHHIDGDKSNNNLSNLLLVNHKEHGRLHFKKISDEDIKKIKTLRETMSIRDLAKKFNCGENCIRHYAGVIRLNNKRHKIGNLNLLKEDIIEMKKLRNAGFSYNYISKQFNCSIATAFNKINDKGR
jgi:transposase